MSFFWSAVSMGKSSLSRGFFIAYKSSLYFIRRCHGVTMRSTSFNRLHCCCVSPHCCHGNTIIDVIISVLRMTLPVNRKYSLRTYKLDKETSKTSRRAIMNGKLIWSGMPNLRICTRTYSCLDSCTCLDESLEELILSRLRLDVSSTCFLLKTVLDVRVEDLVKLENIQQRTGLRLIIFCIVLM